MLSPGRWHEAIPKPLVENLQYRQRLLALCEQQHYRQLVLHMCRHDILFWINSFVYQFNPLKKGGDQVGPFNTWDFQDEVLLARPETHDGRKGIVWCYENNKSAIVEKSREMGASWLFLIFQVWLCLFHRYTKSLNISRSADAVDCKSPDSLFWKIRFIHENMPEWMTGPIVSQSMYLEYDRTTSFITGEASTGRAGVGGRAGVIFIDEFSKIREDVEVRRGTASTADCRFFNGTHEGLDSEFFRLTLEPELVKIQIHWTQHPDKKKGLYRSDPTTNSVEILDKEYHFPADYPFVRDGSPTGGPYPGVRSPWYDAKVLDIGNARGVAMELDINPTGSVSQFFDAHLIRRLILENACDPYWEGDLHYDHDTARPIALIQCQGGPFKLWMQPNGQNLINPDIFAMGSDIAAGTGATPSVLSAIRVKTGEKVMEYANPHILPDQFAILAVAVCWLLKSPAGDGALFAWEMQGPGMVFGNKVIELGYRNVFVKKDEFELAPSSTDKIKPGWYPSPAGKRLLLDHYRAGLSSRQIVNRSELALKECLAFKYDGKGNVEHGNMRSETDPSGASVNHADRVIADGLAWKMAQALGIPEQQRQEEAVPLGSLAWRRAYNNAIRRKDEQWA